MSLVVYQQAVACAYAWLGSGTYSYAVAGPYGTVTPAGPCLLKPWRPSPTYPIGRPVPYPIAPPIAFPISKTGNPGNPPTPCTLGGAIGAVVIGEGMNRVIPYAVSIGAGYYNPPPGPRELSMLNNKIWINEVMDDECKILDGGPETGRTCFRDPTSPYYIMEPQQIEQRGYPTTPVYTP